MFFITPCLTLTLTLIHPHPTGHIGLHSDAIRVCQDLPPLLLLRWTPSFVSLCWLCSSSSLLVDLVLSHILVPACTMLAVVCADDPYAEHVQASKVVFLSVCCPWFVVRFWFWPQRLLSYLSKRCPRMPSMLLCHLWCAASSLFVIVAVNGHTSAPYRRVDKIIASYNFVFTLRLMLSFFQILLILPNTAAAFSIRILTSFSQLSLNDK